MMNAFFDGGCWPNPNGDAFCAILVKDNDTVVLKEAYFLGSGEGMSCNTAEYEGLISVLAFLKDDFLEREIIIYGDSDLVIKQMSGQWKIKAGHYVELAKKAKQLASQFSNLSFEWIPREKNTICDELATDARLDMGL